LQGCKGGWFKKSVCEFNFSFLNHKSRFTNQKFEEEKR